LFALPYLVVRKNKVNKERQTSHAQTGQKERSIGKESKQQEIDKIKDQSIKN
jgi:hypothetical protein